MPLLQTALLSVMYMTAIGFGMVLYGIFIDNADGEVEGLYKNSTNLFFSGGFLSALSWVCNYTCCCMQYTCTVLNLGQNSFNYMSLYLCVYGTN